MPCTSFHERSNGADECVSCGLRKDEHEDSGDAPAAPGGLAAAFAPKAGMMAAKFAAKALRKADEMILAACDGATAVCATFYLLTDTQSRELCYT